MISGSGQVPSGLYAVWGAGGNGGSATSLDRELRAFDAGSGRNRPLKQSGFEHMLQSNV